MKHGDNNKAKAATYIYLSIMVFVYKTNSRNVIYMYYYNIKRCIKQKHR